MNRNQDPIQPFYRVARAIVKPIAWLLFFPKYIGKENIPEGKCAVLCCNHISMLDPVFLALGSKRQLCYMAKKELFSVPVLSSILRGIGTFPVDRKKRDTEAIRNSLEVLENGKVLGIFPEGTRSKNNELGQFKVGTTMIAAKQQSVIVPAAIYVKNGKIRLWSRPVIVFGKPMTPKKMDISGKPSSAQVRAATDKLRDKILLLWKKAKKISEA